MLRPMLRKLRRDRPVFETVSMDPGTVEPPVTGRPFNPTREKEPDAVFWRQASSPVYWPADAVAGLQCEEAAKK